ncbi:MAG TPA: zinc ribbon domain-containing protein [Kofleriaceae bacterium]|jgi:putative FmdB family regulatory protein|nr:zinc ribbon domain-containing protein [Kofleriaceae bacterium]
MPVYEYQCKACGRDFEYQQRMSDPDKTTCEACGGSLDRLISRTAFALKGSGWYKDLYASPKPEQSGAAAAKSDAKADTSSGSADKPAAKSSDAGGSGGASSGDSSNSGGSSGSSSSSSSGSVAKAS